MVRAPAAELRIVMLALRKFYDPLRKNHILAQLAKGNWSSKPPCKMIEIKEWAENNTLRTLYKLFWLVTRLQHKTAELLLQGNRCHWGQMLLQMEEHLTLYILISSICREVSSGDERKQKVIVPVAHL